MTKDECVGRYVLNTPDYSVNLCGKNIFETLERAGEEAWKNCEIVRINEGMQCDNFFLCNCDTRVMNIARGLPLDD